MFELSHEYDKNSEACCLRPTMLCLHLKAQKNCPKHSFSVFTRAKLLSKIIRKNFVSINEYAKSWKESERERTKKEMYSCRSIKVIKE